MTKIEKERKAFEEQFVKVNHEIDFWSPTWDESINDYRHISASIGWRMWQASANREGYKLVSIQPDNKTIVSIERMVENQIEASGINQDPFRLDGENIYKAMIGVADE